MTLTFGSLFSGIGGMDLGLERAGMECKWQVEIDPYCQNVLARHWPEVPKYGDVYELPTSALSPVDAICGGFPCQPVSHAGQRKGQDDHRWLWPEFARLVDGLRPRYVIVENVPGIYSLGGAEVVADLASMGYDAEWGCLPAEAFGAPHRRERFVLVAHTDRAGPQGLRRERELGEPGEKESAGRNRQYGGKKDVANGGGQGLREPLPTKLAWEQRNSLEGRSAVTTGEMAHTDSDRRRGTWIHEEWGQGVFLPPRSSGGSQDSRGDGARTPEKMANTEREGLEGASGSGSLSVRSIFSRGWRSIFPQLHDTEWYADPALSPESGVGRVANGVPDRVDRIRSLGNSVVPNVFEYVGRQVTKDAQRRGYIK